MQRFLQELLHGAYEAHELRDADQSRYLGKGVQKAISNIVEVLAPELLGMDVTQQTQIDRLMIDVDGTDNKNWEPIQF